jgi:hypothetical protein
VSHRTIFDVEVTHARKPDDPEIRKSIFLRDALQMFLMTREGDDFVAHNLGELPEGTELA